MKNLRGIYGGTLKYRREMARYIKAESYEYGQEFIEQHRENRRTLDRNGNYQDLIKCWRNKDFLVQLYLNNGWERLSINRTVYNPEKDCWLGDISWDELMIIKDKVGFGDRDAIEIYPKQIDVIYVTYMRHLFLIPENKLEYFDCIWRKQTSH